jgi:hypothetical protein
MRHPAQNPGKTDTESLTGRLKMINIFDNIRRKYAVMRGLSQIYCLKLYYGMMVTYKSSLQVACIIKRILVYELHYTYI